MHLRQDDDDDNGDDDDDRSIGSDDTMSVALSLLSGTTAVSLHPSRHCFERMLERDVDVDEMRVTKKYGKRSWVGRQNRQTECRVGWRIVVPVRELRLPGYQTETELTCWRSPITGMWISQCGAQYSLRHYNKLTSRGVVCIGIGSKRSFLEIACGVELDTYYEYSFVSIVFEAGKPPRLSSFSATLPPQPRCMPLEASKRELDILRPCTACPEKWVHQAQTDFGEFEWRNLYEQHLNTVADIWERCIAEPLKQNLLGQFSGHLTGLWEKPNKNRFVAMLHWNGSRHHYEPPSSNEVEVAGCSVLEHQTPDTFDSVPCHITHDDRESNDCIFFIQLAPDDKFCELGVGHLLRHDKLHLRRGDCEPKGVGPSSLLNHVLALSVDGRELYTRNTGKAQATLAFMREPLIPESVGAFDYTEESSVHDVAMLAIRRELFYQYSLHNLAREGLVEEAVELLMSDSEALLQIRAHADDGLTPLHVAAREGHMEMASVFLRHSAEVNQRRLGHRSTPLHYAIQYQHERVVDLLLNHGASVDRKAWEHLNRALRAKQDLAGSSGRIQQLLLSASPDHAGLAVTGSSRLVNGKRVRKPKKTRDFSHAHAQCHRNSMSDSSCAKFLATPLGF